MSDEIKKNTTFDEFELQEWLESLEYILQEGGPEKVKKLLHELDIYAHQKGVDLPFTANTPYINTIPKEKQPAYPGGREIERRIKSIIRWNAMAMVVRANRESRWNWRNSIHSDYKLARSCDTWCFKIAN